MGDTLTSKLTDFHEDASLPRELRNSSKCAVEKGEVGLNTLPDVSTKAVKKTQKKSVKQNSFSGQLLLQEKGPQIKNDSKNKNDDYEAKAVGAFRRKSGRILQTKKLSLKESEDDEDWEDVSSYEDNDFSILNSKSLRKTEQADKVVGEKSKRKPKLSADKKSRQKVRNDNVNEIHLTKDSDPEFEMKDLSSDSDETDDWEEVPGKNH